MFSENAPHRPASYAEVEAILTEIVVGAKESSEIQSITEWNDDIPVW